MVLACCLTLGNKSHERPTIRRWLQEDKAVVLAGKNVCSQERFDRQLGGLRWPEISGKSIPELLSIVRDGIYGNEAAFNGPFGPRKCLYMDHTASGQSLRCIEDVIAKEVLPYYGNTHTSATHTSSVSTLYRKEARNIVKEAVGAGSNDCVIFCGSGSTAGFHKLVHHLAPCGDSSKPKPVVFIGPFEHHSNILPWREAGCKVVQITDTERGQFDISMLETRLQEVADDEDNKGRLLIGAFSAASNVTGIVTDDVAVTELLHKYGGLALWDYSAAASHIRVEMNPSDDTLAHKDAVVFSGHKLLGGPQTPGVLVAKRHVFDLNPVPHGVGGGTVVAVMQDSHIYVKDVEEREEGGTPGIIESIRLGLVFRLMGAIGVDHVISTEALFTRRALERWNQVPEIEILGPTDCPRTPVISFLIQHAGTGMYLHYDFVVTLLNDLFGIQSRGGCACAGLYGQNLLGIDTELAKKYEYALRGCGNKTEDDGVPALMLRPGFTRISVAFHATLAEIDFVIDAVHLVAKHGWKLLPFYAIDSATCEFALTEQSRQILDQRPHSSATTTSSEGVITNYRKLLVEAMELFENIDKVVPSLKLHQFPSSSKTTAEHLRWFMQPDEARALLVDQNQVPIRNIVPFIPRSHQRSSSKQADCMFLELPQNDTPTCGMSVPQQLQHFGWSEEPKYDHNPKVHAAVCSLKLNPSSEEERGFYSGWQVPLRSILEMTLKAMNNFSMLKPNDNVLVALSGGPSSLTLLHVLKFLQSHLATTTGKSFEFAAFTLDPGLPCFRPSELISYLRKLGVDYFFEVATSGAAKNISSTKTCPGVSSHVNLSQSRKAVMKRALACAKANGYNVLAFAGPLWHDTSKPPLLVKRKIRVIYPFIEVQKKAVYSFCKTSGLPAIPQECSICSSTDAAAAISYKDSAWSNPCIKFPSLWHYKQ